MPPKAVKAKAKAKGNPTTALAKAKAKGNTTTALAKKLSPLEALKAQAMTSQPSDPLPGLGSSASMALVRATQGSLPATKVDADVPDETFDLGSLHQNQDAPAGVKDSRSILPHQRYVWDTMCNTLPPAAQAELERLNVDRPIYIQSPEF